MLRLPGRWWAGRSIPAVVGLVGADQNARWPACGWSPEPVPPSPATTARHRPATPGGDPRRVIRPGLRTRTGRWSREIRLAAARHCRVPGPGPGPVPGGPPLWYAGPRAHADTDSGGTGGASAYTWCHVDLDQPAYPIGAELPGVDHAADGALVNVQELGSGVDGASRGASARGARRRLVVAVGIAVSPQRREQRRTHYTCRRCLCARRSALFRPVARATPTGVSSHGARR